MFRAFDAVYNRAMPSFAKSMFFDAREFAAAKALPAAQRATAQGVILVEPVGFRLSGETSADNTYMDLSRGVDPNRALAQHRALAEAIRRHTGLPVRVFRGDPGSPDAVFCNNVFASAAGRLIVGAMRHPERQRESRRQDIIDEIAREGRTLLRMDDSDGAVAELTGPLVIDRARGIGFHGLSERCNEIGAQAMHRAFDLVRSFCFPLAAGEYHTNVLMAVLAGRVLVIHRASIGAAAADAISALYAPHVLCLDDSEKAQFVGNCIALTDASVWMSAVAERALSPANRQLLRNAGLSLHSVEIDEIEKAGGSLRCCVAEVF